MIDHFNLPVTDLERSRGFYERVLACLGHGFLMEDGDAVGFGRGCWSFGIVLAKPPLPRLHVAFAARQRDEVDRFHAVALAAGATSNGPPGVRAQYEPSYYAAFVLDPDGHNVEAVCRRPPANEELLTATYAAFNARDVEAALRALHPDVDWPNGMEGGRVHGREAVRDYWTRQWATIDPRVVPRGFATDEAGRVVVDVHQVVRARSGGVLSDQVVRHVYVIEDGLIRRMDIRA